MFTHTTEIARSPEDVLAYLDQLDRHGEWQTDIKRVIDVTPGPVGVGTRATEYRKMPIGTAKVTYEIAEYEHPRRVVFVGVSGPVRPRGVVTVEPLDGGARSKLSFDFEMVGHGIGKLFAPMAYKKATTLIPEAHKELKRRLESGA
jgi:hypothetical protein